MSEDEIGLIPYLEGDTLIFESTNGLRDTLFVLEIEKYTNPDDHLALFPDYHETIFVNGEMTVLNPPRSINGGLITRDFVSVLELRSSKKGSYISLGFQRPRDTLRSNRFNIPVAVLLKISEEEEIVIDDNRFKSQRYFKSDLQDFKWRNDVGYIEYKFSERDQWNLVQLLRNGENIIR